MDIIKLEDINVEFDGEKLFTDLSLNFEAGKFYTLLGPSGCGKTTILNLIAGFANPTNGKVLINDEDVTNLGANKREVNTVFQDYALFPHLNVYDNIAFGLRLKGVSEKKIRKEVAKYLSLVSLSGYEKREINEMSGGQRQRIAIARALINEPKVLLLDEPLSALDLKLRTEMQYVLKEIQQNLKITFIFVTHDQEEALALSDYIYVLNRGKIEQLGEPKDIYDEPNNRFVANFIGESNIFKGRYVDELKVHFAGKDFTCVDGQFTIDERVDVVIRPEDLVLCDAGCGKIDVEISFSTFKGMNYELIGEDEDRNKWLIHTTRDIKVGDKIGLKFEPFDIHVMKENDDKY